MDRQKEEQIFDEAANKVLFKLVTALLADKPRDPVPYMYGFIKELSQGVKQPEPMNDNEINEVKNLQKKVEQLKDRLAAIDVELSGDDHESDYEEESEPSAQEDDISQEASLVDYQDDSEEDKWSKPPKRALTTYGAHYNKQRGAVSAEAYGSWNHKGSFQCKVVPKSNEVRQKLTKRLRQALIFKGLEQAAFQIVVDSIEEVHAEAGTVVIKEGDYGDCMYIVESGSLNCTKVLKGTTLPTFLKQYNKGECFGELSLLYNTPRAASITAITDSVLWRLDREIFNHIVKNSAMKKRERFEHFLEKVKLLHEMVPYERSKIADALQEEIFFKDDIVIQEGDQGDKFYIVLDGEAIATKKGVEAILKYYSAGDYFGERALLTKEPRAASITVITEELSVASLDRETFCRLMGPLEDIMKRDMEKYELFQSKQ